MKSLRVVSIVIVSLVIGFAGGSVYGLLTGVSNNNKLVMIANGYLATALLVSDEKSGRHCSRFMYELNVDNAVLNYDELSKSKNTFLTRVFFPDEVQDVDKAFEKMIEYRKTHPVAFNPEWAKQQTIDETSELKTWRADQYKNSIEMLLAIQRVLREHGVPEEMLIPKPLPTESAK